MKRIAFRVDASLQIGTGHLTRCLTLAEALRAAGAECQFICREHPGNLIDTIRRQKFAVTVLQPGPHDFRSEDVYGAWLGTDWQTDAEQTRVAIEGPGLEWLVVDHYAIDACWERALKPRYGKLLVIDDLADRDHACDVLLDQTFSRDADDYKTRVPESCVRLTGAEYALLRPQFAALRPYSLKRREKPQLKHLLISMGGVDNDNVTVRVFDALEHSSLPDDCRITVVMGATAPWLDSVRRRSIDLRWPVEVAVNVSAMAQLMADSDLAIGTAGATSWERCCLGLPSIVVVTAANQQLVAEGLAGAGAVLALNQQRVESELVGLLNALVGDSLQRSDMSRAASRITDGRGVDAVIRQMEQLT